MILILHIRCFQDKFCLYIGYLVMVYEVMLLLLMNRLKDVYKRQGIIIVSIVLGICKAPATLADLPIICIAPIGAYTFIAF